MSFRHIFYDMNTTLEPVWLTRKEAATHLRVSVATIDRWTREGRLARHAFADLPTVRFRRSDLDALLVEENIGE